MQQYDLQSDDVPTKFTGYERLHDDCTMLRHITEDEVARARRLRVREASF